MIGSHNAIDPRVVQSGMMKRTAINKLFRGWHAEFSCRTEYGETRATGTLMRGDEIIRPFKNVKVKDGRFNVDNGGGSGVKITFQIEEK